LYKEQYKGVLITIILIAFLSGAYVLYGKYHILNPQYNNMVSLNEQRTILSDIQVEYNKIVRLHNSGHLVTQKISEMQSMVANLENVQQVGMFFDKSRINNLIDELQVSLQKSKEASSVVQKSFNKLLGNYIDLVDENIKVYHHKSNLHSQMILWIVGLLFLCCVLMFIYIFIQDDGHTDLEYSALEQYSDNTKIISSLDALAQKIEGFTGAEHCNNVNLNDDSQKVKGNQFISNISHEFRTPLTAIIGFSELLKHDSGLDDEQKNKAGIIHSTGLHLLEIISDVLDLSKIESGTITFEKNNILLPKLCHDVESILLVRFDKAKDIFKVVYHYPLPNYILGDLTRIKQIIINLCSNAMKFTEKGSVEMHVEYKDRILSIRVKDSGLGIPKNKQELIFEEFSQIDDSNSRKYAGTGLGLPISKRLCQGMGGDLVLVDSLPHQGSTFKASMITELSDESEFLNKFNEKFVEDNKIANIPDLSDFSILIADDNEINKSLVKMYLDKTGIEMSFVSNGLEAYEYMVKNEVSIALLDIQMPVMTGMEAIVKIRDAGITVPVIAFTASVTFSELDEYRRKGFTAILGKPINTQWFYKIIHENLIK
jgi:signal transduction histidine kinase